MTWQQIAVAAELLRVEVGVATSRGHDMRGGIVMVSSDICGVGSVLVGPDLSVLCFVSSISPDLALEVWDTGRRTAKESFAALHRGR